MLTLMCCIDVIIIIHHSSFCHAFMTVW